MSIYTLLSIILTLAVLFGYINHRFVKMPTTIAIMSGSLALSLFMLTLSQFTSITIEQHAVSLLNKLDFHGLLMNGMLSFLLFAGALTINLSALKKQKWETGILASVGTITSAFLIGTATYYLLQWLGIKLDFIYCMLFGALISPTDPIAVLAVFKEVGAPRHLDVTVSGESLFNDGVGIVIFLTIYHLAFVSPDNVTWGSVVLLFLRQALGGVTYGAIIGVIALWLIKPVDEHKIEILITLAVTTGGYVLAEYLGVSGPLAMVVAGLIIGNHGRRFSMSATTRDSLDNFWELVDEILNAILFLLIGLELMVINLHSYIIYTGLLAIPLVLLVRFMIVTIPISLFKIKRQYCPLFNTILVWGGLRGGLAVALALALPPGKQRSFILAMTYAVVCFAIIVQGSTIKQLTKISRGNIV